MTSLNPVYTIGAQLREAVQLHENVSKAGRQQPRGGDAEGRGHPARRDAHGRLPAPVLGRDAPARDDRDGARQQPRPADRRRADHRARRDHPGPDPEADEPAAARLRQRHHPGHARPRRGRRDGRRRAGHVRGQAGREGRLRGHLLPPRAPLHLGPAQLAAAPGAARARPEADPGHAAVAAAAARPAAGSTCAARTRSRPVSPRCPSCCRWVASRPAIMPSPAIWSPSSGGANPTTCSTR